MNNKLTRYETPFSPFWGLTNLQREVDSLFQDFITPWDRRTSDFAPNCEVDETETHYQLKFDIPGIKKEDVQIEVRDNQLLVSGERKEEVTEKHGKRHFTERNYGAFSRVFSLPATVKGDKIEASYTDGVLRIMLPKSESAKPRRIQIGGKSEAH